MSLNGKRIFVVEDDAKNMAIIAVTLKRHGAIVVQDMWNSGTVDMIEEVMPVDAILLDLMLRGGRSGYDIIDQIKARPELSGIPIVIVSAADASIEMKKARQKGCMGYIEKPINYYSFPRSIATILEGTPVWGGELMS
jgi:CheY-like chemotaxis protein